MHQLRLSQKKVATWLLAIVLGLVTLALLYAFLFYPAEYVLCVLRWGDADVYDYQKFPARTMPTSMDPFHFAVDLQETAVNTQFNLNDIVNGDDAKTYYYPDLRDLALN